MDEIDFRLLQAMGFQPYLPGVPPADALRPGRLAKRVGLGLKATKARIARLEADGIIASYETFPNLGLFPFGWKSFHFRVPEPRKSGFLASLASVDGLVGYFDFVGADVCVDLSFSGPDEMHERVSALSGLAGASPWEFYDNLVPPVKRTLTPLDWRIVRTLRHDAKRPIGALARELNVTQRTIKNRFDRMVAEGNLWVVPRVDYGKIPGFIPYGVLVYARPGAPPRALAEVRRLIAPDELYSWAPPARELGQLGALLRARTTSDLEAMRRKLAAVPGIERVELLVPAGVQMSLAWLDAAIERRAAKQDDEARRDRASADVERATPVFQKRPSREQQSPKR